MKRIIFVTIAGLLVLSVVLQTVSHGASGPAADNNTTPKGKLTISESPRVTDDGWFAPPPEVDRPGLPKKIDKAFIITIREPITQKTFDAVKRKFRKCRAGGAQLIIFDMDTWGGAVGPALDITRHIKHDMKNVYLACYVRTRAISAGAMIAMACNEIIMAPTGKFGNCAPILAAGKLEGVEREKIETVIRTEFKESADRNGYNIPLSTSMVSHDQEVWLVRNLKTRQLRYVLESEYQHKVLQTPGAAKAAPAPKIALNREWELLKVVLKKGKLLTMTTKEAVRYGFVKNVIDAPSDNPYANIIKHFNITTPPVILEDSWSETLVGILTSPVVTGGLFFLALLFGYTEMHTPGFGICGILAVICLAVLFGSQFLVGLANWWEIAIFALGIVLILLEIFVIPGFGAAGISGICLCVIALMAMLVPNAPTEIPLPSTQIDWAYFNAAAMSICIAFVAAIIAMGLLSRVLPKWSLMTKSQLILSEARPATDAPRSDDSPMLKIKPGDIGIVVAQLHPVGEVRFGNNLLDAVSDSGIIDSGATVRVVTRDGNRIVVESA